MRTTILSPSRRHRATLADGPGGVFVAVRRWEGRTERQVWAGAIDAPFHVVADRMVDMLDKMALTARGYVEDRASRVTRYRVFRPGVGCRSLLKSNPEHDLTHRVYSGKAGALRFSARGVVGGAIPFSPRTIARLLDEGAAGGIDAYEAAMRAAKPA